MKLKHNQKGFGHLLVLCAIVVIAAIAFVAYRVNNSENDNAIQKASQSAAPETIQSTEDLTATESAVDQAPVDSDLNPDDLNEDVDSLL